MLCVCLLWVSRRDCWSRKRFLRCCSACHQVRTKNQTPSGTMIIPPIVHTICWFVCSSVDSFTDLQSSFHLFTVLSCVISLLVGLIKCCVNPFGSLSCYGVLLIFLLCRRICLCGGEAIDRNLPRRSLLRSPPPPSTAQSGRCAPWTGGSHELRCFQSILCAA